MNYEIGPAERAHGDLGGSYYGSSVRILARAPDWVVFTCGGVHFWRDRQRNASSWHNQHALTRDRVSTAAITKIKDKLDERCGPGAGDVVLQAWKAKGTAIVDGGGKVLRIPRNEYAAKVQAEHRAATIDWKADLGLRLLCCKECGTHLRPKTEHHRIPYEEKVMSLEECQRRSNYEVVAVHGYDTRYPDRWNDVERYETWDGKSFYDKDFCDNKCAARYGRRAVAYYEHPLPVFPRMEDDR